MGIPVNTVRTFIRRGRDDLKRALLDESEEED